MDGEVIMTGKRIFILVSSVCMTAAVVLQIFLGIHYLYQDGSISPALLILLLMLFVPQLKKPRNRLTVMVVYLVVTSALMLLSGSFWHMGILHFLVWILPVLYLLFLGTKRVQNCFYQKRLVK